MARYTFLMECKKGAEEEYKRRHEQVYPDLLEEFKNQGIKSYSIFMNGNQLIAYIEVDDFEATMSRLADHPANIKWQEYMSDILVQDEKGGPKIKLINKEVFYFTS